MADRIFVAKEAFWYTTDEGEPRMIAVGARVREGHPILTGRESLFRPDEVMELDEPASKPDADRAPVRRPAGRPAAPKKE